MKDFLSETIARTEVELCSLGFSSSFSGHYRGQHADFNEGMADYQSEFCITIKTICDHLLYKTFIDLKIMSSQKRGGSREAPSNSSRLRPQSQVIFRCT
jgi:hypothetical protein